MAASSSKKIIIERYIENGGLTHVVKYVVVNGNFYMQVMGDRYVLNNGLITALTLFPSQYTKQYLETIDSKVKDMFLSIGFRNGVFFFQALPDHDKIYVYEMGLRTGGGMTYKLTQNTTGNSDLQMLIHFAITGEMCEDADLLGIDPYLNGKVGASLALPLRLGVIEKIQGDEQVKSMPEVVNFTNFCEVGSEILPSHINTLSQLYARVMIVRDSEQELFESLNRVRNTISVKDVQGEEMIIWDTFDRIYQTQLTQYVK